MEYYFSISGASGAAQALRGAFLWGFTDGGRTPANKNGG